MAKVRWGIGGLTILWIIAVGLWAAVALARIARSEMASVTPTPRVDTRLRAEPHLEWSCQQTGGVAAPGRFAQPASHLGMGSPRHDDDAAIRRYRKL